MTPHVDLMMGTSRRRTTDEWVSTLFVAYLVFPLETLNSNDVSVQIDGPAGWNDGAPIVRDYSCGAGETCWVDSFVFGNYAGVEAVTGDYQLTVTIGEDTYTAGAHVDATYRHPRPGNLTATGASSSGVTISWTNPADTKMNVVSMRRGTYEETVVGYQTFFATSYTYDGLSLADGPYGVEVVAMNADIRVHPVKVEPFAQSYEYVQFTVGE